MYDDREDIGGEEEEQEGSTEDAGRDDDGVRGALDDLGRHFQDRPPNAFPTESSTHTLVYGPTSFLDKIRNFAIFMYAALAEGLVLYFNLFFKKGLQWLRQKDVASVVDWVINPLSVLQHFDFR